MGGNEKGYYNLTHSQKRIWYIEKVNLNSPLHNIGGCLKINEKVNIQKLNETINIVIKKNEGLRLRFTEKCGQPIQYVSDFKQENIDYLDFSNCKEPEIEHGKWSKNIFKKAFEFENNKLYYFAIYKINQKEYGILLNIHHIISDGWSISLVEKQICEIYSKLVKNEIIYQGEYCSYINFVEEEKEYLDSDRFAKNKNYWNEKFKSIPEEFLYNTSNSLEGKRRAFNIDVNLSKKINEFVKDSKCSLNIFFIAILLIYINKAMYKKDIVIGTPVFNRANRKQKNMVGMFTSTVPFRFELDDELNIENLIKQINKEFKLCLLNQKYPYDLLIKDLGLSKEGYDSLFKMSVNYYKNKFITEIDGADAEAEEYYCGNQSYSLQLTIKEWMNDVITLNFDYKTSDYSEEEIQVMSNSIINIITEILENKNCQVKDIKLLGDEEINHKIHVLNSTSSIYPSKIVSELFEAQVSKSPDKVALEFKHVRLSYKELNEKSNQLANYLRENDVGQESIVGVMMSHSIELVIGILAVLKAGGTYLPIDPNYPPDRVNYMLQDSESTMLLVNFYANKQIEYNGAMININEINVDLYSKENLIKVNQLNNLAYIIYTSGSTGKPKGVMIEHRGLTNYIWWAKNTYLKNDNEVMALYSSIAFDLTITSIFTPLISGSKIIIYDTDETEFVLYKILRENKATVVKLTPAHLTLIKNMNNSNSKIKRFIVGGEDLKVNLAKEILDSFGGDIEICNEYGPTETVVGCMIHIYSEEKDDGISVPIGYPADNVQLYILDNELNVVPTGIAGELYISGDGVARGYLNREKLTLERFIENPFVKGKRMYKTGDIARYLKNGLIEYLGRSDNQVKIRGYRIELGEIEKYLLENESVRDTVVTFKEDSSGNKILNAYIVSKKNMKDLELKEWLNKFLPKYMIPANFVFIDQLPLTLNGKINYELLPKPIIGEKEFIKSETNVEQELVKVMEEILGIKNISMNDNYYQLGGDSIKAIQISSRLKDIGLNIQVKDILTNDSIKEIAATVEKNRESIVISQEKSQGIIEKTPITEWFFEQKFLNENLYNQYVLLEYNIALDFNKVKSAVNKLIEYHDGLRINYDRKNDKLFYNNDHYNKASAFKYLDLLEYFSDEERKDVKKLIHKANINFDIENSLLFNVTMFNLGKDTQSLLFTAHHLVVDGISWRIILSDFITILNQLNDGDEVKLPMKTHSFKEWTEELNEYSKKDFKEEKAYWNNILDKKFSYPIDFNGEDIIKTSSILSYELDEDTTNKLMKKVNEVYNIEFNEVLIIALAITIKKFTNNEHVMIELERHGRENISNFIDVSRTVGWFTIMYPAYFKVELNEIEKNIKSIKEQIRNIPNKGFNYGIFKFLNKEIKGNSDKYIRFNYLGDFDNIINEERLNKVNIEFGLNSDKENSLTTLIDISAMIVNKNLKINVIYSNARFHEDTIKSFINIYRDTLRLILDKCENKDFKEFTPSDFDAADISQEDLDALFD
ncbi:plipastatin synthase subunit C [Clostridium puniceum]|uniref:Plipastatin synthase subunit C n=1 Tax=Clostridium puniceum TaxID=29367 RepID=A0A1S8TGS3_9CLOT|nr:non-ribosomal peptide synthetase [Clostridium puniceum]OOM76973.1 plipastatin synthase subunit C [Clostridium puniceum]